MSILTAFLCYFLIGAIVSLYVALISPDHPIAHGEAIVWILLLLFTWPAFWIFTFWPVITRRGSRRI
jgi:hypothetical protein